MCMKTFSQIDREIEGDRSCWRRLVSPALLVSGLAPRLEDERKPRDVHVVPRFDLFLCHAFESVPEKLLLLS